jgi:hypothetical protein
MRPVVARASSLLLVLVSEVFAADALPLASTALADAAEVAVATPAPKAGDPTSARTAAAARPTPDRLTGGASSLDELVTLFLDAVSRRDRDALEALRVTEAEYRSIIVPGSVAPGAPPQVLSEEGLEYFWGEMNQKSAAHREAILEGFGGQTFTPVRHSFEKGIRDFAGYKAYGRLRVILRDDQGAEVELRTGSIVERDGRFKFATFIRD